MTHTIKDVITIIAHSKSRLKQSLAGAPIFFKQAIMKLLSEPGVLLGIKIHNVTCRMIVENKYKLHSDPIARVVRPLNHKYFHILSILTITYLNKDKSTPGESVLYNLLQTELFLPSLVSLDKTPFYFHHKSSPS